MPVVSHRRRSACQQHEDERHSGEREHGDPGSPKLDQHAAQHGPDRARRNRDEPPKASDLGQHIFIESPEEVRIDFYISKRTG